MRGTWLLAAAAVLVAAPSAAAAPATVNRIAGNDRYETAAQLALHWRSDSEGIVARGDDPADALAGSYVAGSHITPVLLTEQHRVPQVTIDALHRMSVYRVHVLGGPGAVGDEVLQQFRDAGFPTVDRIAGADRYGTAAAVARDSGPANIGNEGSLGRTVLLANGLQPADALAAGPIAYGQQWPVLLTTRDVLPDVTRSALDDLGVQHVIVVGGTGVVSDGVVADLQRTGRTVERIAGPDRMATATALADFMIGLGEHVTRVEVASASSFADALGLGPHAAPDAPVLLCATRDECGQTTVGWIMRHAADVDTVVIAGGVAVVSQTAEAELQAAAS